MTLDDYMEVLQQRADEWSAQQSKPALRYPPLLEWFIRDDDVALVELPTPKPKPKHERRPRHYRPASYWRARAAGLEAQIAILIEPLIPDRAAAGGAALGPKRTARIQSREDSRLRRYVALSKRLAYADSMLRSAEAREANGQRSTDAALDGGGSR